MPQMKAKDIGNHATMEVYMVVSLNRGPQYRPQNATVLIIGTPNKVPLILGNPKP